MDSGVSDKSPRPMAKKRIFMAKSTTWAGTPIFGIQIV
jgi:hypothetical protein